MTQLELAKAGQSVEGCPVSKSGEKHTVARGQVTLAR